jgi:hypothetical protein
MTISSGSSSPLPQYRSSAFGGSQSRATFNLDAAVHRPSVVRGPPSYVDRATQTSDLDFTDKSDEDYETYLPTGVFRYDKWIGEGRLLDVTHLAWAQARQLCNSVVAEMHKDQWIRECHNILLSIPPKVLTEVAVGNLMRAWKDASDADERGEAHPIGEICRTGSDWDLESKQDAPVIYLIGICDNDSQSPTPQQYLQVTKRLRSYLSMSWRRQDVEDILEIDNVARPQSTKRDIQQGKALFLCKPPGPRYRIGERHSKVNGFCDALERRFSNMPAAELDLPLKRPLVYIGHAFNFARRRTQFMEGDTFLLHLVHNTLRVRHSLKRTISRLICLGSLSRGAISFGNPPDLLSRR